MVHVYTGDKYCISVEYQLVYCIGRVSVVYCIGGTLVTYWLSVDKVKVYYIDQRRYRPMYLPILSCLYQLK